MPSLALFKGISVKGNDVGVTMNVKKKVSEQGGNEAP